MELISYELTSGSHSISLAIAEDSVSLDKIVIKSFQVAPVELGEIANNICEPEIYVSDIDDNYKHNGYSLGQNYPNPFTIRTTISFEIRKIAHVSLKIFDVYGAEVAELAGKEFQSGSHTLEFSNEILPPGNYFYTIRTEEFSTTRKMVVLAN